MLIYHRNSSYLILPYGNTNATPMNPSVKKWIKWMRIIQLVLRCLEILAACGLLVMMILIRNVDNITGWIMRIVVSVVNSFIVAEADIIQAWSSYPTYRVWNLPPRT